MTCLEGREKSRLNSWDRPTPNSDDSCWPLEVNKIVKFCSATEEVFKFRLENLMSSFTCKNYLSTLKLEDNIFRFFYCFKLLHLVLFVLIFDSWFCNTYFHWIIHQLDTLFFYKNISLHTSSSKTKEKIQKYFRRDTFFCVGFWIKRFTK